MQEDEEGAAAVAEFVQILEYTVGQYYGKHHGVPSDAARVR